MSVRWHRIATPPFLAAATVLALLSYVAVSVDLESRELKIKLQGGKRAGAGPVAAPVKRAG